MNFKFNFFGKISKTIMFETFGTSSNFFAMNSHNIHGTSATGSTGSCQGGIDLSLTRSSSTCGSDLDSEIDYHTLVESLEEESLNLNSSKSSGSSLFSNPEMSIESEDSVVESGTRKKMKLLGKFQNILNLDGSIVATASYEEAKTILDTSITFGPSGTSIIFCKYNHGK